MRPADLTDSEAYLIRRAAQLEGWLQTSLLWPYVQEIRHLVNAGLWVLVQYEGVVRCVLTDAGWALANEIRGAR